MKAERRHELKTNSLARGIEGAPDLWREYGSRVLLVVLVAAIVFLLVRYWNDKKLSDARLVAESVETASTSIGELKRLPLQGEAAPAVKIAEERERIRQQAEQAINTILNTTKDPKILASTYLNRGDLYWSLANFPELPGATTLPTNLQLTNRDLLLDQAASAYQKVLDPSYAASVGNAFAAHMGLAAVAENQQKWDQAKSQYQAIADATNMPDSFKALAKEQLDNVPKYQTAALLVPAPPPAPPVLGPPAPTITNPTTQSIISEILNAASHPASTQPASPPTSEPHVQTSQPATTP